MSTNQELDDVRALLVEAASEIPGKLDALLAQVGDAADPALVAEIKTLATGLADIVANPVVEVPVEEVPVVEVPVEEVPVVEVPVEEVPVAE